MTVLLLDTRFLQPHPRTLLWWQQREQCRRCVHYRRVDTCARATGQGLAEHCAMGRDCGAMQSETAACIHMRDAGSRCGPEGWLFEAAR